MNLLGAVWSNNALSTLRVSPNPAYPSRNRLSPFGLGESVLKLLFSGSHWVSRTSACENCCCDFLLSLRIDVCQRDGPPRYATTTCYWNRGYALERSGRKVSRKRCHDGEQLPGEQVFWIWCRCTVCGGRTLFAGKHAPTVLQICETDARKADFSSG